MGSLPLPWKNQLTGGESVCCLDGCVYCGGSFLTLFLVDLVEFRTQYLKNWPLGILDNSSSKRWKKPIELGKFTLTSPHSYLPSPPHLASLKVDKFPRWKFLLCTRGYILTTRDREFTVEKTVLTYLVTFSPIYYL